MFCMLNHIMCVRVCVCVAQRILHLAGFLCACVRQRRLVCWPEQWNDLPSRQLNLKNPPKQWSPETQFSGATHSRWHSLSDRLSGSDISQSSTPQRRSKRYCERYSSWNLVSPSHFISLPALVLQTGTRQVAANISPHGLGLQQPAAEKTTELLRTHTLAL